MKEKIQLLPKAPKRKFNGKTYKLYDILNTKKKAQNRAKLFRMRGYNARVINWKGYYEIYIHKKK